MRWGCKRPTLDPTPTADTALNPILTADTALDPIPRADAALDPIPTADAALDPIPTADPTILLPGQYSDKTPAVNIADQCSAAVAMCCCESISGQNTTAVHCKGGRLSCRKCAHGNVASISYHF